MIGEVAFDKRLAFEMLRARGAAIAVVRYSGGNDSGGADSVELFDASDVSLGQVTYIYSDHEYDQARREWVATGGPGTPEEKRENELYDQLTAPVYAEWGSFAGEFYVSGALTFDVVAGTVKKEQSVETPTSESGVEYL
jgi:hypothetical protein